MILRVLAIIFLCVGACQAGAQLTFRSGVDVTGAVCCKDIHLHDVQGNKRSLSDFRGKVTALFFGFTQCPEVCPTTLLDMQSVLQILGPQRSLVQTVFITVDPERDTPEFLASYLGDFDKSVIGLRGSADETLSAAKEFRIFYQRKQLTGTDYTIDHTAGMYLIDQAGKTRVFVPYGAKPPAIASDIRLMLENNGAGN